MATCGNCKQQGQTVEHIKACYSDKGSVMTKTVEVADFATEYVKSADFAPMATAPVDVPDSMYALHDEDGLKFYQLRHGKKGSKWANFQFVDRLIGHPGDWAKYPVKGEARKDVLADLAQHPLESAVLFSAEFTICAVCGSPLSDAESIARGLGPVCATRF